MLTDAHIPQLSKPQPSPLYVSTLEPLCSPYILLPLKVACTYTPTPTPVPIQLSHC